MIRSSADDAGGYVNRYLPSLLIAFVIGSSACSSPSHADENRKSMPKPTADALWKAGSEAFEAARYDEAATTFKQLAKEYPSDRRTERAFYFAALSAFNLKQYAVAIDEFRSLVAANGAGDLADDALFFAAKSSVELRRCVDAKKFLDAFEERYPKSNVRDLVPKLRSQIGPNCCAKLTDENECWFYGPAKRRCTGEEKIMWNAVVTSSCGARSKARAGRSCYANEGLRLRLCTDAEAKDENMFDAVLPDESAGVRTPPATAGSGSTGASTTAASKWLPRGWTDLGTLGELRAQFGKKWSCHGEGTTSDGEMSFATCIVCRDKNLTFPCAEISLSNGEVLGLSFPLPNKSDARVAAQELTSDWGKPTRSLRNPLGASGPASLLCWDRQDRHAAWIQRRGVTASQPEYMLMTYSIYSVCPPTQ
jgi:tetratricopeptide (TPR) repeat protein